MFFKFVLPTGVINHDNKQLRTKVENMHWCCTRICQKWQHLWYNMLSFYSQVANILIAPRVCKQSAPCSRQITTPATHHLIFTGQMLFLATTNSVKARKPERKTNRKSAQWTYSETAVNADRHWPLLTKHEMIPYGILLIITATHSHVENCILNQQQSSNSAEFF